jgi:plastocyanin
VLELSKPRALVGCAAVAATALAVAVPGASGVQSAKPKTAKVTVADDTFTPATVSVKAGGKVQWAWAPTNIDTHNVVLTSTHPDGVKTRDYRSGDAAVQYKYTAKFDVPGTYKFICTYHKTVMQTTVTVKKH